MNCKKCEYPLWNLRARVCPECGEPFLPSHYRFALNSVRFCCPHCLQDYYGTAETGHLVPRCFECVKCRQRIDMDEMILLPTEGIDERRTRGDVNPWLDADRGILSRWLTTLGRGMANPVWLLRCTPVETSAWRGWGFAVLTHLVFATLFLGPLLLLCLGMSAAGAGAPFSYVGLSFGVMAGGAAIGSIIFLGVWAATAHGLLRIGGRTAGGMGRTALALCFTCGPQFMMLVPCLNFYFGWIGTLWWIIVAGFALAAAQKVSGGRAALAVATFPVVCVIAVASLFIFLIAADLGSATASASYYASPEAVSTFRAPIQSAVAAGQPPRHAAELIGRGNLAAGHFVSAYSGMTPADATLGGLTLEQADTLSPDLKAALVQRALDSLAPGAPAHRVGDFVFVLDALGASDPSLWVVVESWHPSRNVGNAHMRNALTAGGQVVTITPEAAQGMLNTQNAARSLHGLPPLPDPATVLEPSLQTPPADE